jgi:hypothetical protein
VSGGEFDYFDAIGPLIEQVARTAAKKYRITATGVMDVADLTNELWVAALKDQEKLSPHLEEGKLGYVAKALQYIAHDAVEPEWKHRKRAGGTVEDLETGSLASSGFSNKTEYMHRRAEAGRNPEPPSVKLLRTARRDFESAWAQMRRHRDATHVIAAAMRTLDPLDAEILHLFVGYRISIEEGWIEPGSKNAAIALEVGRSERTVRRRLAAILERLEEMLRELDAPEAG